MTAKCFQSPKLFKYLNVYLGIHLRMWLNLYCLRGEHQCKEDSRWCVTIHVRLPTHDGLATHRHTLLNSLLTNLTAHLALKQTMREKIYYST